MSGALELATINVGTANTVADLMGWADNFARLGETDGRRWSFRGQPQEFQKLIPSLARQFNKHKAGAIELIEREMLRSFRDHYERVQDRSVDMPEPCSIGQGFDLRCLSVMQHHEVPTRLLDWTGDFWTAVYFACSSDVTTNAELWLYDRAIFADQAADGSPFQSLITANGATEEPALLLAQPEPAQLLELDPRLTPRMRSQHAHHTLCTNLSIDHAPMLNTLATAANEKVAAKFLFKRIIIQSTCKSKALQFLAEHKNITAGTIFPDVVGLGRFLRWQLESLKTLLF